VSESRDPIRNLRIERNRFECQQTHIGLIRPVRQVVLSHNVFVGGANAINLQLSESTDRAVPEHSLVIANNSFFNTVYWLGLINEAPVHVDFATVCNNLIVNSQEMQGHETVPLAAEHWTFQANWWELPQVQEGETGHDERIAKLVNKIELLSRMPSDADFLRPAPNSPLRTSGCGGQYDSFVGAIDPND
jgi:hypothetical protein